MPHLVPRCSKMFQDIDAVDAQPYLMIMMIPAGITMKNCMMIPVLPILPPCFAAEISMTFAGAEGLGGRREGLRSPGRPGTDLLVCFFFSMYWEYGFP